MGFYDLVEICFWGEFMVFYFRKILSYDNNSENVSGEKLKFDGFWNFLWFWQEFGEWDKLRINFFFQWVTATLKMFRERQESEVSLPPYRPPPPILISSFFLS